jgi:flagellar motor switch protein FliG
VDDALDEAAERVEVPAPGAAVALHDGLDEDDLDAGPPRPALDPSARLGAGRLGAPAPAAPPRRGGEAGTRSPLAAAGSPGGAAAASLGGARKAAVFILALEEEVATLVLRSLSDAELARITSEIAELGVVDKETIAAVIREFLELEEIQMVIQRGGLDQAVRLVERSFPREKAGRILEVLGTERQERAFSFLEDVEAETLAACLREEHPQTLAAVLAHLSPRKAAELLERLDPELRREVVERIAALDGANSAALERLEHSLRKHLDAARFESLGEGGGIKAAADILRATKGGGTGLLDDLRAGRPDLAEEIDKHLFVFEDLARLDDRAVQAFLKEIDTRHLALALKNASEAVKGKVFHNLSRRAGEMLEEEMDYLGPVRFSEVAAARRAILETILRLERSGDLYITGRGREENRIVY